MPSIRTTKTASGATAVQAAEYKNRKVVVLKHFGSAHTEMELEGLIQDAKDWVLQKTGQTSLFNSRDEGRVLHLGVTRFLGVRYMLVYRLFTETFSRLGFDALANHLLRDLTLMRIIEPSSKRRALLLLARYFGIVYSERTLYRTLPKLIAYKEQAEKIAAQFAKRVLNDNLSFVLYDVTTLYFESFEPDELRMPGYSKDNKSNQPQIVLGLLVNTDGFPLGYDVFPGNTFEGKTMLPILHAFRKTHSVAACTVVADAAMISIKNIDELCREKLNYIIGARAANLSPTMIEKIAGELKGQRDGATVRTPTLHGDLICSYSEKRCRKDKREMKKQIQKAKMLVMAKESGRRAKFVEKNGGTYALNAKLIAKTEKLLGIKGYYTNIPEEQMNDSSIIARYGNLWRVEQSFRMSKSDLAARPIFHHKEDSIKAHIITCFIALAMGKYLEWKTGSSIRHIVDLLKQVPDARMLNTQTKKEILLPAETPEEVKLLLQKLHSPH